MQQFDHERMDVYRRALQFVRLAASIRHGLVPGHASLADQLDRAAVSIALNIAEGAGEFARKEKAPLLPNRATIGDRVCDCTRCRSSVGTCGWTRCWRRKGAVAADRWQFDWAEQKDGRREGATMTWRCHGRRGEAEA